MPKMILVFCFFLECSVFGTGKFPRLSLVNNDSA